jgi:iron(III) transport system ATP-binding protein
LSQAYAIEFKGVSFKRDQRFILNNYSCQIQWGERLAIIGASGSGKTTFLRLCAGLERLHAGQIFLRGQQVDGDSIFQPPHQRHIGFVFQNFALFEGVKIKHNIYYGCKRSEDYQEADRLIQLMGLENHLNKRPSQLSGGERQKVALARSLALKPDIILLDEPLSSIDAHQSEYLINEMISLFDRLSVTAVMVTHSPQEAQAFATRKLEFGVS